MPNISFEIELDISGSVQPAERMTSNYPGCDASVEDFDIHGLGHIVASRPNGGPFKWTTHDLLKGVDLKSPAIQKLFDNIIEAKRCEMIDAIFEDYRDQRGQAFYGRHA